MDRLPSGSPTGSQWPGQVADRIDSTVGLVRDKAVRPITLVARGLVYGPIIAAVGLVAAVLAAVAAVRGLNEIPGFRDWISLLAVGGFFSLLGLFLLGRGRAAARPAPKR
jgi:hypothetical protein